MIDKSQIKWISGHNKGNYSNFNDDKNYEGDLPTYYFLL